jgi:hypothetical protein
MMPGKSHMRVFLDEQSCTMSPCSVAEAIAGAAAIADARGRLIVDVMVDGARWSAEQVTAAESQSCLAEEVRLTSANPGDLVLQTLDDAQSALAQAGVMQRQAAEMIQADAGPAAWDMLNEAVAIWLTVQQAVSHSAELMGLDLDRLTIDSKPSQAVVHRLHEQLRSMRSAMEARDPIGLADTLLYEMPDVVEEWQALLTQLQQQVQRSRPGK